MRVTVITPAMDRLTIDATYRRDPDGYRLVRTDNGRSLGRVSRVDPTDSRTAWRVYVDPDAYRGDGPGPVPAADRDTEVPGPLYRDGRPVTAARTRTAAAREILSHLAAHYAPAVGYGRHPQVGATITAITVPAAPADGVIVDTCTCAHCGRPIERRTERYPAVWRHADRPDRPINCGQSGMSTAPRAVPSDPALSRMALHTHRTDCDYRCHQRHATDPARDDWAPGGRHAAPSECAFVSLFMRSCDLPRAQGSRFCGTHAERHPWERREFWAAAYASAAEHIRAEGVDTAPHDIDRRACRIADSVTDAVFRTGPVHPC